MNVSIEKPRDVQKSCIHKNPFFKGYACLISRCKSGLPRDQVHGDFIDSGSQTEYGVDSVKQNGKKSSKARFMFFHPWVSHSSMAVVGLDELEMMLLDQEVPIT
jgi:hypothetical protein